MIHETNSLRRDELPAFARDFLTEDMLLFDIETTGFSSSRDPVYCVGCGYVQGKEARVELFFAENPKEETGVLASFFALAETHPEWITFNGTTFDLPFLRKRAEHYAGVLLFPGARSHLDLCREARAMRGLLGLPSYKQKSIEQFLGIRREDIYSGGQLIDFYREYVRHPDPALLEPILLHNREDVTGMFDLLGILAYRQFAEGRFCITETIPEYAESVGFLNVKLKPESPLPQSIHRISDNPDGISFLLDRGASLIRIPVRHGTLKHFFDNPEDYFYLPDEDTAIHKSVGGFVDPSHRKRATKRTCYVKKECDYLALPLPAGRDSAAFSGCGDLKKSYGDKNLYLELPVGEEDLKTALCICFNQILYA